MKAYFLIQIACFLSLSMQADAYVIKRGDYGEKVAWPRSRSAISFNLNPYNSHGISESRIISMLNSSFSQWEQIAPFDFSYSINYSAPVSGENNIFFSSDSSLIPGSGVLAVTRYSYKIGNGEITRADIVVLNNPASASITQIEGTRSYLGDIFTHELGHVVGFDHSQLMNATMYYKWIAGQSTVHTDETAGVSSMYGNDLGSISGKIVGGYDLIGIFGTNVEAISANTGDVVAATISDDDGTFTIYGLEKNVFIYFQLYHNRPDCFSFSITSFYRFLQ